jgi:hypothetical protein
MSADTVENKVLNLFKAMNNIVKGFEDEQTFLDSLRVDYSCAGGSCEVWYSYLCSNAIVKDHEIVRYVSAPPLGLPPQIDDLETHLRVAVCELLYSIHGSSCSCEAGSSGYFHARVSSSLITGEHFWSELDASDECEDSEHEQERRQVYVFCIKSDPFEDDWEVAEVHASPD